VSAERTSRAAEAAQQLCAALWEALHEQLRAGDAQQAAMLADRIAETSRSLSALALLAPQDAGGGDAPPRRTSSFEAHASEAHTSQAHARPGLDGIDVERDAIVAPACAAAIVDERSELVSEPIAIRDVRRSHQDTPWGIAVQRRLDRYLSDRERFAVMLLELLDAERLRLAQSPLDAQRQVREIESTMVQQLRPADTLVREADGRYWLLAPDTDAATARLLASRIAAAARQGASHRSVPLEVAVGIALCPEHGLDVGALLGHAEVDLYAAQAIGRTLSDPDPDPAA
jgi:GGDEF domain-containing protein